MQYRMAPRPVCARSRRAPARAVAAQHGNTQVPHRLSTAHALSARVKWRIQTRPHNCVKSDASCYFEARPCGEITKIRGVCANAGSDKASGRVSKDRR